MDPSLKSPSAPTVSRGLSRRAFVAGSLGATAAIAAGKEANAQATRPAAARSSARAGDLPNILFIMSDEHDAGVTGCYGDPLVQTENLDRLAANGVTFDACYCNSPLCAPSRLSFTAGQYINQIGAWSNHCWLPSDDHPSLPRILQRAGYETYLCGKQHYDKTRRYGFDDMLPGIRMNARDKAGRGGRRSLDAENNIGNWRRRSSEFQEGNYSKALNNDRLVTERLVEFFMYRDRDRKQPPFFMFAGYLAPHYPLTVPDPYASRYVGKVPPADVTDAQIETLPTNYKVLRNGFGLEGADPALQLKGRELYWSLVDWFDDQIGLLLDALERSRMADNTIVIYTSDHGENKGDHGLWWKNCMYEHGARVPLIVSWPERFTGGQRHTQACSLVDVVQTVIEMAGGEPAEHMVGDSLLPWLDDPGYKWKDLAVSEYYGHHVASGFSMIRQGDYKYVYHTRIDADHGPERELYNLKADPGEWDNLSARPEHAGRIDQMHNAMVKELGADPDETELRCRREYAVGYGRTDI